MNDTFFRIFILASFLIISLSCKKEVFFPEKGFTTFVIPEGSHRSTNKVMLHNGDTLKFAFRFDSSAIYQTKDPVNQHSINKLYGLSDCGSGHHDNSARIGWRWLNDQLELFAYYYKDKKMKNELITTVEIGKTYEARIVFLENEYHFSVENETRIVSRKCNGRQTRYFLFPYFGGKEQAPHEIRIEIKNL